MSRSAEFHGRTHTTRAGDVLAGGPGGQRIGRVEKRGRQWFAFHPDHGHMGPFPRQYEATLAVRRPQPPDLQALPTGTYQISTAALAPHVQHDEINSGKNPDLLEAIRQNGIQEPLEVTTHADERGVVLRGGSHRVNAALALGIPTVPVQLHRMR